MTIELAVDPTLHEQEWDFQVVIVRESDHLPEWDEISHLATEGAVFGIRPYTNRAMQLLAKGDLTLEKGKVAFIEFHDRSTNDAVQHICKDALHAGLRMIYTTGRGQIIMANMLVREH
jgi:hypothetical protein